MSVQLIRGDATSIPLADESVDLIVTSPPYFALRSYTDGGEHYDGQIGSEDSAEEFLEALWVVTEECKRVLKPTGSMFVNLGDKYAGSGGHNNSNIGAKKDRGPSSYNKDRGGVPAKSLMGLPWRYAIGCVDQLGLLLRAEIVWSKPNGLPESVTDRVRRSHEQWFHMVREPRYFSAIDEIREPHTTDPMARPTWEERKANGEPTRAGLADAAAVGNVGMAGNSLGKLPGSVWTIPSEPLKVPAHLGVDHFAAFPQEWPRRLILGWSPSGYCVECDEPRCAVIDRKLKVDHVQRRTRGRQDLHDDGSGRTAESSLGITDRSVVGSYQTIITGYECACDQPTAPTRPAIVLDPFVGTGTTVMVAHHLGRHGIGMDLSADYLRLANWRVFESGHAEKKEQSRIKAWEKEQRVTKLRQTISRQEAVIEALKKKIRAQAEASN